jgi:hypothetical protein
MEKEVIAWNPPVDWVKNVIEEAGTKIGSVHFNKRTDGQLRKMSYRLHVQHPSVAAAPNGTEYFCKVCLRKGDDLTAYCKSDPKNLEPVKSNKRAKKDIDKSNDQMTVFDTNKVVRDKSGKIIGRGAWRTVPLERVVRIKNCGTTYVIKRY